MPETRQQSAVAEELRIRELEGRTTAATVAPDVNASSADATLEERLEVLRKERDDLLVEREYRRLQEQFDILRRETRDDDKIILPIPSSGRSESSVPSALEKRPATAPHEERPAKRKPRRPKSPIC